MVIVANADAPIRIYCIGNACLVFGFSSIVLNTFKSFDFLGYFLVGHKANGNVAIPSISRPHVDIIAAFIFSDAQVCMQIIVYFVFAIYTVHMTILVISMQANLLDTDYNFICQSMFGIIAQPGISVIV
ncbi:hypothetical protein SDC9_159941 [bioreactor metagenome]|uniref:Uncharacterized protein n=1 Tax=bioreactor metagenome TaxID=1076179 RepID=A0A645FK86_9ZZZZ